MKMHDAIRNPYGIPEPKYGPPPMMPHMHASRTVYINDTGHHPGVRKLAQYLSRGAQAMGQQAGHRQPPGHVHFRPSAHLDTSQVIDARHPQSAVSVYQLPWWYHPLGGG